MLCGLFYSTSDIETVRNEESIDLTVFELCGVNCISKTYIFINDYKLRCHLDILLEKNSNVYS